MENAETIMTEQDGSTSPDAADGSGGEDASRSFRPKAAGDWDGQVRKVGAVCAATGKELVAGDEFVSLLRFGADGIERTFRWYQERLAPGASV